MSEDRVERVESPRQMSRAQAERAALLAELRGIAAQLNRFYPRPVGQSMSTQEETLRARACAIEEKLS